MPPVWLLTHIAQQAEVHRGTPVLIRLLLARSGFLDRYGDGTPNAHKWDPPPLHPIISCVPITAPQGQAEFHTPALTMLQAERVQADSTKRYFHARDYTEQPFLSSNKYYEDDVRAPPKLGRLPLSAALAT